MKYLKRYNEKISKKLYADIENTIQEALTFVKDKTNIVISEGEKNNIKIKFETLPNITLFKTIKDDILVLLDILNIKFNIKYLRPKNVYSQRDLNRRDIVLQFNEILDNRRTRPFKIIDLDKDNLNVDLSEYDNFELKYITIYFNY